MDETSISPRIRLALNKVHMAKLDVQIAIVREADEVLAARRSGVTWARIGEAYGITRQAAQARWREPASPEWRF
jgi:hypothetical protein